MTKRLMIRHLDRLSQRPTIWIAIVRSLETSGRRRSALRLELEKIETHNWLVCSRGHRGTNFQCRWVSRHARSTSWTFCRPETCLMSCPSPFHSLRL